MNGAGQGPFSDLYKFSTSKAPPPQVKGMLFFAQQAMYALNKTRCSLLIFYCSFATGVKVDFNKDSNSFRIEWFAVQCNDALEYQVQICKRRDQDYRTVGK